MIMMIIIIFNCYYYINDNVVPIKLFFEILASSRMCAVKTTLSAMWSGFSDEFTVFHWMFDLHTRQVYIFINYDALFMWWNAVSNESWEFLRKSHEWPMIDVSQLNPDLYEQIENLKTSRVRVTVSQMWDVVCLLHKPSLVSCTTYTCIEFDRTLLTAWAA